LRTVYPVTQHSVADDFNPQEHYYENLKSRYKKVLVIFVLR